MMRFISDNMSFRPSLMRFYDEFVGSTVCIMNGSEVCAASVPDVPSSSREGRDVEASLLNNNHSKPFLSSSQTTSFHCLPLRVLFFLLLVVSLSVVSSLYFYHILTACTSQQCILSAARLLSNIDESVDPCTDFYTYACGTWMNTTVNLNYPSWNMLHKTTMAAHDRIVRAVIDFGEENFPHELNSGEKGVVKVFQQCADADGIAQIGIQPVADLLKSLGDWMPDLKPTRRQRDLSIIEVDDDVDVDPYLILVDTTDQVERRRREAMAEPLEELLLRYFNISTFPLFFAGVQVNYRQSSEYIITIYEQVPILPDTKFYMNPEPTVEQLMTKTGPHQNLHFLYDVGLQMTKLFGEEYEDSQRRVAEMIVLEWKISNCKPRKTERDNDQYDVITLSKLQQTAPMINWKQFLTRLTQQPLSDDEPIALKQGIEWMQQLNDVIDEYSSTFEKQMILRSYMKWKILVYYLSYTRVQCPTQTLWSLIDVYSGPRHLRKELCIMRLSGIFPLSLPSFLRKIDGYSMIAQNKKSALEMGENIRKEYTKVLQESGVLDEETRRNVIDKMLNMTLAVAYSDKMELLPEMEIEAHRVGTSFFDSMLIGASSVYRSNVARLHKPVDTRDWVDTRPALSSIPIHNYERNMVLVPMDVINAPLFDYRQLDSLNYGALGSFFGHEMSHAFDNEGKRHGSNGSLGGSSFWSDHSLAKYREQEKCVVESYTNLTHGEDATISRYENIADMMGLEIAFKAWQRHGSDVWQKTSAVSLNANQRFFVSYAQSWCALESKRQGSKHLMERMRVVGTLRNSIHFAEAFHCPVNSPMNPSNKCTMW